MATGRTDAAARPDECRYSIVLCRVPVPVPVCLCECDVRCVAVRCGTMQLAAARGGGQSWARRNAMRHNATRHARPGISSSSSHTRASLSHFAACPGRSAVVDEQMLPGTGPRRAMAPWHRWLESCATSKKGPRTCLDLSYLANVAVIYTVPARPACSSKRAAPAWFDRAYILIKRHDGRWWLRGRSEDYAYHPPPDAALTMTRTAAPPRKSGNHVGNLSFWSMQSVSDIEPIDRTHFGCFLFSSSSFLFLLGGWRKKDWLATGQSKRRGCASRVRMEDLGPLSRTPRARVG